MVQACVRDEFLLMELLRNYFESPKADVAGLARAPVAF